MTLRTKTALVLLAIVSITSLTLANAQDKFRLKPGAKGKVCLECHTAFKEKLKAPFIHTPVKAGDCSDCHNPHTSSHGKLLSASASRICFSCHEGIVPEKSLSAHKVAVEGNCVKCHDPHAAKNKNNLLKAGNELCFGCHQRIAKAVGGNKFKHSPVEKGCLNCHTPHASAKTASLLKVDVPGICVSCHKTNTPSFVKQHMGYPVTGYPMCEQPRHPLRKAAPARGQQDVQPMPPGAVLPGRPEDQEGGGRPVPRMPQRQDERNSRQEARPLARGGPDVVPELP
jgi:predicted CXXCH cytochrome family protein